MQNFVPTVYGDRFYSSLAHGTTLVIPPFSTINEKLGIQASATVSPGLRPTLRYWGIGIVGHSFVTTTGGNTKLIRYQHQTTDAALFEQMPFVARALTNDLSAEERSIYRGRKVVNIDGTDYALYYLRYENLDQQESGMEYRSVDPTTGKVLATSPFVPKAKNLTPTPTQLSPTNVNQVTAEYVGSVTAFPITMSATQLQEFIAAVQLLKKDPDMAVISELMICSGVDRTVSAVTAGGSINYAEVIGCQACGYYSKVIFAPDAEVVNMTLDLGSESPLYRLA